VAGETEKPDESLASHLPTGADGVIVEPAGELDPAAGGSKVVQQGTAVRIDVYLGHLIHVECGTQRSGEVGLHERPLGVIAIARPSGFVGRLHDDQAGRRVEQP
jgi:hypothetical protein